MLIAYLDEFGHQGPFIEPGHAKFGHHPIFGYAGFVIPAEEARYMGRDFKNVKNSLFKTDIARSNTPAQWERKGSEYFSTGSVTTRPELLRAFGGLVVRLRGHGGRLFYYGDEKVRGTLKQTKREPNDIMHDALRETINRICTYAESIDEDVLILMDAITDKTRRELAGKMYAHIYSRKRDEMKRIVEAPLHIESKLNSGIQFADWICGLIGRASHYQVVQESEFGWAAEHYSATLRTNFTHESKLHLQYGQDIHNHQLTQRSRSRFPNFQATAIGSRIPNFAAIQEAAVRARTQERSRRA